MLEGIDHIDLRVPSVLAAEEFFTTLGLVTVRRHDEERGSIEMAFPGSPLFFELREDSTATTTTVDHIAFTSTTPDATVDRLEAAGVPFTRRHHLTPTGRTVSNLTDPFGGKWQLAEDSE